MDLANAAAAPVNTAYFRLRAKEYRRVPSGVARSGLWPVQTGVLIEYQIATQFGSPGGMRKIRRSQNANTFERGPGSEGGHAQLLARSQGKSGMNVEIGDKIQSCLRFCPSHGQRVRASWVGAGFPSFFVYKVKG